MRVEFLYIFISFSDFGRFYSFEKWFLLAIYLNTQITEWNGWSKIFHINANRVFSANYPRFRLYNRKVKLPVTLRNQALKKRAAGWQLTSAKPLPNCLLNHRHNHPLIVAGDDSKLTILIGSINVGIPFQNHILT